MRRAHPYWDPDVFLSPPVRHSGASDNEGDVGCDGSDDGTNAQGGKSGGISGHSSDNNDNDDNGSQGGTKSGSDSNSTLYTRGGSYDAEGGDGDDEQDELPELAKYPEGDDYNMDNGWDPLHQPPPSPLPMSDSDTNGSLDALSTSSTESLRWDFLRNEIFDHPS
ncbi:hypothetical protein BN946_scf184903.g7 [Trametes cinnabarina]|uniref:Uncharacterized protein n=1 Tax=Pycnoporus cinnabarinus TaxID=5643 RepID=A0A060SRW4_PYCCI|nr:hypothetical protein BN946_scf184903.g7 [Trametes cinnabarina]